MLNSALTGASLVLDRLRLLEEPLKSDELVNHSKKAVSDTLRFRRVCLTLRRTGSGDTRVYCVG